MRFCFSIGGRVFGACVVFSGRYAGGITVEGVP